MGGFVEDLIEKVLTDPTFLVVGLVLAVFITLAILKKLFKVVFLLLAALIGFAGYLLYTGQEPVEAVEEFIEKGKEVIEEVKDTDLEGLKKDAEKAIEDAKKKVEKKIK